MSIVFLTAILAVTPIAFSGEADAKKCETTKQCEKGQCEVGECTAEKCAGITATSVACAAKACPSEACAGKTCQSTAAGVIQVTATLDSGSEADCCESEQCCANDELNVSKTCCSDGKSCSSAEGLTGKVDSCDGCPICPAELASVISTSAECQRGEGSGCCSDAEQKYRQEIVALHWKLMAERAKSAVLTAQLKHREALAEAQAEFAEQMLKKEIENVQLHAELHLVNVRNQAKQAITATALKASDEGLAARVADLENRLESITVRLATKPTALQTK